MGTLTARRIGLVALPLACAALFTWVYGRHGYSGRDDGLIMALAWRVTRGQLPYLDFFHPLPPISVLVRAASMSVVPIAWQVLFERFLFYLLIAAYSRISVSILDRHFRLERLGLPRWLVFALFFVFSVQNFPPMPWHTVDGVFFSVLAIYWLSSGSQSWRALSAAAAIGAAVFCKQSFCFMVPIALAYLWMVGPRRRLIVFASALALVMATGLAGLAGFGVLPSFLEQMTVQTRTGSLLSSGFLSYFRHYWGAAGPALLLALVVHRGWEWGTGRRTPRSWLAYVTLGTLLVIHGLYFLHAILIEEQPRFQTPVFNYLAFLFLVVIAALLYDDGRRKPPMLTLGLMLGLAWCASLSWGYQTPAFYSAPILFGVLFFAGSRLGARPRRLAAFLLVLTVIVQFRGYQYPFGEMRRTDLNRDLGEVFEKLDGIRTSEANFGRYRELRSLHAEYGDNYIALPAMPLTHYLTGSLPPLEVDWAIDRGSDYRVERLVRRLEAQGSVVFMEDDSGYRCERTPHCSALVRHITENWRSIEKREHFEVYRSRPEAAPGQVEHAQGLRYGGRCR